MIYKAGVKREMTYSRHMFKLIDEAMRFGDWEQAAIYANEISAAWGTIGERCMERHQGVDND